MGALIAGKAGAMSINDEARMVAEEGLEPPTRGLWGLRQLGIMYLTVSNLALPADVTPKGVDHL